MAKIVMHASVVVSVSVVSHGQMDLITQLMQDIEGHCRGTAIELLVTLNTPENFQHEASRFSYPVTVIRNTVPKGFGANHNQAFQHATGDYFCVMNPDIRLHNNPFDVLQSLLQDATIGVAAPVVLGPSGAVEDSARIFPTLSKIIGKMFTKNWSSDYVWGQSPVDVDWVAGMLMMFSRPVFERMQGFDERHFLYYEDVNLCARLHLAGLRVVVCPSCQVVHHAQRHSHRHLKYFRWHVASLFRYLCSAEYCQLQHLHRL